MTRYFLALCVLLACKKKDEAAPVTNTYQEAQLLGTWRLTAKTSAQPYNWNGAAAPTTDIYSTESACQRDNEYSIQPSNVAAIKFSCSVNYPNAGWRLENGNFMWRGSANQVFSIEKITALSPVQFTTTRFDTIPGSTTQTTLITKTYTRQ